MCERYVVVRKTALVDALDLAQRALDLLDRTQSNDPLTHALRGALDELRYDARSLTPV